MYDRWVVTKFQFCLGGQIVRVFWLAFKYFRVLMTITKGIRIRLWFCWRVVLDIDEIYEKIYIFCWEVGVR